MTSLSTSDPLQLLKGVWSHTLCPLLLLLLTLFVLLLDSFMSEETLFDPLWTIAVDLGIAKLLQ